MATSAEAADPRFWRFDEAAPALRSISCPSDSQKTEFDTIDLSITAVNPGSDRDITAALPGGVRFVGGWALRSDDKRWGGLSGLTLINTHTLLVVSDKGHLIQIPLPRETPETRARISPLLNAQGRSVVGKLSGDAEGIAYRDGLAFVSFERDFRVVALNLEKCRAAARGIRIGSPPHRIGTGRIRPNSGPETLMLDSDGRLHIGYEQPYAGQALMGTLMTSGQFILSKDGPPLEDGLKLVGSDWILTSRGQSIRGRLLRAYERRRGNRNRIEFDGPDGTTLPAIDLAAPLTIDNFEGLALREIETGLRVYILSDNNFSERHRTLLFAFDVDVPETDP